MTKAVRGYSDGDEVEDYLLRVVRGAEDLSSSSSELASAVRDWPSQYHLSPMRSNLLRPVAVLLRDADVLEVGAGCGALTTYLAESARSVTAVEMSARRADITAHRCRLLDNVQIVPGRLEDVPLEQAYDVVTLIGVLEYARVFGDRLDAIPRMLQRARSLLRPGGHLLLAIENRLGLKYLAGAPEDHVGLPFFGVEARYVDGGPVTFGRQELRALLEENGFPQTHFAFPFPDYKLPRAVLTERGAREAHAVTADVLAASGAGDLDRRYLRTFSEELAWESLLRNRLVPDLANSFLVVASSTEAAVPDVPDVAVYSTDRRACFAKQTVFRWSAGTLRVQRTRLHEARSTPAAGRFSQQMIDEPLREGVPLLTGARELLNRPGWTTSDLAAWCEPWLRHLRSLSDGERSGRLPGNAVDLIPANLLVAPDGSLRAFDLEWQADPAPEVDFVLVRGLLSTCSAARSVAPPDEGTPLGVVDLVAAVAEHLGVTRERVAAAIELEVEFQAFVTGRPPELIRRSMQAHRLEPRAQDLLAAAEAVGAAQVLAGSVEDERRRAHVLSEQVQALSEQNRVLAGQVEGVLGRAVRAEHAVATAEHALRLMRMSTSWRVSAPLRALGPVRAALQGPVTSRSSLRTPAGRRAAARRLRRLGVSGLMAEMTSAPAQRDEAYEHWVAAHDTLTQQDREAIHRHIDRLPMRPVISVVLPVYNPRPEDLAEAVESVLGQLYPHWQLVVVDDASSEASAAEALHALAERQDARVVVVRRDTNGGITAATATALDRATGEFVAFLDHDDVLAPHALYMIAELVSRHPDADVIYSDEDKIDAEGRRSGPYFKPDWNPELLLGQNYLNHLTVLRRDLVDSVGRLRSGFDGSQDYDLVLRATGATTRDRIHHVPHVLYHWRQYGGAQTFSRDHQSRATSAARRAVDDHLQRLGERAQSRPLDAAPYWQRVVWELPADPPAVTVIVPTRDRLELLRQCVEGVLERTDYPALRLLVVDNDSSDPMTLRYLEGLRAHERADVLRVPGPFNYSRINNIAVGTVTTPLVLLLNNDILVRDSGWLREMVSIGSREGVGVVGAKLLYADDTIQHGGVVLGIGGSAGHSHKHKPASEIGYFGRMILTTEVSAVTGACLLTSKRVWDLVGGLDEEHLGVAFNDVDFCLRVREAGLRHVWTPHAELYHLESASRGYEETPEQLARFDRERDYLRARWGNLLERDPAYNPNLTDHHEDYSLAWPPRVQKPWRRG